MKPKDLYKRKPQYIDKEIYALRGFYSDHIPEVGGDIDYDKNTEIEIHCYKYFDFDGRRDWRLASVKFKDQFVMIIQNAGREGDDHERRFITDFDLFKEMIEYLKTLTDHDIFEDAQRDVIDIDSDQEDLVTFYGNTLDGEFKRFEY